jgi:hypothetical protein
MSSHALFNPGLAPIETPSEAHVCESGVVACRVTADGFVAQELYRHPNGLFGFRYFAWVAWRDADDEVRSHTWHRMNPDEGLITDVYPTACEVAEHHAVSKGLKFPPWVTP